MFNCEDTDGIASASEYPVKYYVGLDYLNDIVGI